MTAADPQDLLARWRALGLVQVEQAQKGPDLPGLTLGRVVEDRRTQYLVMARATDASQLAQCRPELLRDARKGLTMRPVVGDFVWFNPGTKGGIGEIAQVLDRKSSFVRRRAGLAMREQVVVANIDTVFVMTALDGDFSPRRLERYLTLCYEAPAQPVIVLTKSDTVPDVSPFVEQVQKLGPDLIVESISSLKEDGFAPVYAHLRPGETVAFLGSSGVGKSTLINLLLGRQRQLVAKVRSDGRGRHTTTTRQLVYLESGAIVVDTPGMRELGVWAARLGLSEAFPEIAALSQACRFKDCRHDKEPGCALQAHLASGEISRDRFESYLKLAKELVEGDAGRARPGDGYDKGRRTRRPGKAR